MKNRNSFWSGTQFSAGVCRAGESENRRQRYRGGVRQDRQGDPGRAVRLRRGDRPHLAGCAVLSRLAQERRAHRHGGREQSVLVERGREIFQQRARDQDRRGRSAHGAAAVEPAATRHERQIISQPRLPDELGRDFQLPSAGRRSSNRSPAAAGKTFIGCTIRKNFTGLTTRPASSS